MDRLKSGQRPDGLTAPRSLRASRLRQRRELRTAARIERRTRAASHAETLYDAGSQLRAVAASLQAQGLGWDEDLLQLIVCAAEDAEAAGALLGAIPSGDAA